MPILVNNRGDKGLLLMMADHRPRIREGRADGSE